jgi:hypothetical protein
MESEPKLGLMRTAVIVWASGVLASSLLAIFISPVAWALIAGSARHIDQQWGLAATLVVANALLAGVGVTFGARLFGFRLSYASAVVALAFGGVLATGITRFLFARTATDPTGIAIPALGPALMPLRVLLGILLPAYIINAIASRGSADPVPPEALRPPYSV